MLVGFWSAGVEGSCRQRGDIFGVLDKLCGRRRTEPVDSDLSQRLDCSTYNGSSAIRFDLWIAARRNASSATRFNVWTSACLTVRLRYVLNYGLRHVATLRLRHVSTFGLQHVTKLHSPRISPLGSASRANVWHTNRRDVCYAKRYSLCVAQTRRLRDILGCDSSRRFGQ